MIGKRLGKYSLTSRLSEGGMGTIYIAHDRELDREVALKIVRADLVSPASKERFQREILLAAKLQHPNIVPLP